MSSDSETTLEEEMDQDEPQDPTVDGSLCRIVRKLTAMIEEERLELKKQPINELTLNKSMAWIQCFVRRCLVSEKIPVYPAEERALKKIVGDEPNLNIVKAFETSRLHPDFFSKADALAVKLMKTLQLDESTSFSVLLDKLHTYYATHFPKLRMFVFAFSNGRSPVFRVTRSPEHRRNVAIYFRAKEVYAITRLQNLFSRHRQFCPDCSTTFSSKKAYEHKKKCPLRCPSCCRYGYAYPCKEELLKRCEDCNRTFRNSKCFTAHRAKVYFLPPSKSLCEIVKACPSCAESYVCLTGRHICGETFCKICTTMHPKNQMCSVIC